MINVQEKETVEQTSAQVTIKQQPGKITSETAKAAQAEMDSYQSKLAELSNAGFDLSNINFVTMKDGQQVADKFSVELIDKYHEVFKKLQIKIISEYSLEEQELMNGAKSNAEQAEKDRKDKETAYNELLNKPRKGLFNIVGNFFSGLERRTEEAKKASEESATNSQIAKQRIEEAEKQANAMKKDRRKKMTTSDFTLELVEVSKEMKKTNEIGQKAVENSLKRVVDQRVTSEKDLEESSAKLKELDTNIAEKTHEVENARKILADKAKGTAEYNAQEIAVAKLESAKKALESDLATETAINLRLRSDILTYINSETSANDQISAFKVRNVLIEMNIKHAPIIAEMTINSIKAGDILQASANQQKTHNALELTSVKQIGMVGGQSLNSEIEAINDEITQKEKLKDITEQLEEMRVEKTSSLMDAISKAKQTS